MNTLGFIGMGNMAQAIASGIISHQLWEAGQIYAYAPHYDKLATNAEKIGFTPCRSLKELTDHCDCFIIACKPYQIEGVLSEIRDDLKDKACISIAAGWDYKKYSALLDSSTRIQYIMPNTPVMVGEGVMLFEETHSLTPEEHEKFLQIFSALGLVEILPSHLMNAGMALTGCAPAFMDLILEALGDAAVKYGIPRKQAYSLASQMMLGSAKLQLVTGEHPGVLKDNVCSPAGTTIRGVAALEHAGVRSAMIDAIDTILQ